MAAVSTIAALATTAAGIASIDQTIKGDEARRKQAGEQKKFQEEQKAEIGRQKDIAADKRKQAIDLKRRQLYGAGDQQYSLTGKALTSNAPSTSNAIMNKEVLG